MEAGEERVIRRNPHVDVVPLAAGAELERVRLLAQPQRATALVADPTDAMEPSGRELPYMSSRGVTPNTID